MDPYFICVSGITVARSKGAVAPYVMEELYPYTDRIIQERLGSKDEYEPWDFENNRPDIIVLNLGTNDSTGILFSEKPIEAEKKFEDDYYRFLKHIRKFNGSNAKIICALGSIDYYLYDRILSVTRRLRRDNGDENIYCMKYSKMLMQGRDVGACFHPSLRKHEEMAEELVSFITVNSLV